MADYANLGLRTKIQSARYLPSFLRDLRRFLKGAQPSELSTLSRSVDISSASPHGLDQVERVLSEIRRALSQFPAFAACSGSQR
jgi:hypothetical protein